MADVSGGMQDAFRSLGDASELLGGESSESGKALASLTEKLKDGAISIDGFKEGIARLLAKVAEMKDETGRASTAVSKMIASIEGIDRAISQANFTKFAGSVTGATSALVSAIDAVSAVASSSTGAELASSASKTAAGLGSLAMAAGGVGMLIMPEFGIPLLLAGAALKLFTSASSGTIAVVDKAAKAQENMVSTLIQSGVAITGHTGDIRGAAQSASELATNLGITKEKAGAIGVSLSDMGVNVVDASESMSNLKAVSDGYGKQIEAVTVMSRGMGVSLETATGVVGIFSARAGLSGDDVSEASGKMAVAQKLAGVQSGVVFKNFSALADSSRQYGTDINFLAAQTATFSKELNKGTLSISDVIALTNVQSQSMENQAALADHIMQTDANLSAQMGLVQGDAMGNIIRLGQHADLASGSIIKWAREIGAGAGGSIESQAATMNAFLKTFGKSISDANLTMDIFTGKIADPAEALKKIKESSPEEEFKKLKGSAAAVLADLRPATEQLNTVSAKQLTAADALARSSGMLEAALITAKATAGASLLVTGDKSNVATSAIKTALNTIAPGLIPATNFITEAIGTRAQSPASAPGGSKGGVNINVGGVHIGGGDGGTSLGGVKDALDKMVRDIMKQLEDQWNSAHLAH